MYPVRVFSVLLLAVSVTPPLAAAPAVKGKSKPKAAPTPKVAPNPRNLGMALINASQAPDHARLKQLLAAGANPNAVDRDGCTALMFAVGTGEDAIVKTLLAAKASVNSRAADGRTPITVAIGAGEFELVQLMLQRGPDLKGTDAAGRTLLHVLLEMKGMIPETAALVKLMLAKGANVNAPDKAGVTPLMYSLRGIPAPSEGEFTAAWLVDHLTWRPVRPFADASFLTTTTAGSLEMVELLIASGANVNAQDARRRPSWTYARARAKAVKEPKFLQLLKSAGATEPPPDLLNAVVFEDVDELRRALAAGAKPDQKDEEGIPAVVLAAGRESDAVLRELLAAGVDTGARGPFEETALLITIERERLANLRLLLSKGADPNLVARKGLVPLVEAAGLDSPDYVAALLEKGARPNAKSEYGRTAAHYAAVPAILELLAAKGADLNQRDDLGMTPLAVLVDEEFDLDREAEPLVVTFLKLGADVNLGDEFGVTPLMRAAEHQPAAVVKLLQDKGAKVNARDSDGWTALMKAVVADKGETVVLLLKGGADVALATKEGETALSLANENGHIGIAKLLKQAGAKR
jgi:uncharacterized protein